MWDIKRIVKKGEYLYAYVPDHPRATKKGYVLHHRVVMENKLGRLLTAQEIVHHKDGDKHNNNPSNLEVMLRGEHSRHHAPSAKYVEYACPECGSLFTRRANQRPEVTGKKQTFCSRSCNGKYQRARQPNNLRS